MSERSPLVRSGNPTPIYVFQSNRDRIYRQKVHRLQCYICAGVLAIITAGLVFTLTYDVDSPEAQNATVTPPLDPNNSVSSFDQLPDAGQSPVVTLTRTMNDVPQDAWQEPINATRLAEAIAVGKKKLYEKEVFEKKVPNLPIDSPAFRHGLATSTSAEARKLSRVGFIMEAATRNLLSNRSVRYPIGHSQPYELQWLPQDVCNGRVHHKPCEASPYRTYDGTCNNLQNPYQWGVAMRAFRRYLPPHYADGISAPRKSTDGSPLPSARNVGSTVHRPSYRADSKFTVMLAVWGQFIDHDITATAISIGSSGESISCCQRTYQAGLKLHPECFTVSISKGDPFYDQYNITCMEFVRASPAPTCSFGSREQLNQASSYIDGSVVYGKNEEKANNLRSFTGGELKTLITPDGIELLPVSTDPNDGCNQEKELAKGRYCFDTGDARANENSLLITMHLLWVRQHNIVARKLSSVNPQWNDERLYQETRKIIGAQMQHIHYNEFLPILLGSKVMTQLKMLPREQVHSDTYDPQLDASIANEFACSSYRFGHTLLPGLFKATGKDNSSEEFIEMHKMLFNPFKLYEQGFIENAVRGALETAAKKSPGIDSEFTQHLFERENNSNSDSMHLPGLDLVALNIQRGRDHGVGGYPHYREHCGLKRPKTFNDLEEYMDKGSVQRMKQIYRTVDDIDLYTGSVSEIPLEDSIIGPTISCHLTDQFLRLQRGDRFWFENSQYPQAFTQDQLNSIRQISLAKVICDTSGVEKAQPRVMQLKSADNEVVGCADLPGNDFNAWKEDTHENDNSATEEQTQPLRLKATAFLTATQNEIPQENVTPAKIRLSLRLVGGELLVDGKNVWENNIPLVFPCKNFKEYTSDQDLLNTNSSSQPLLWNAAITSQTPQFVVVTGEFSMPIKNDSNTLYTAWINGQFTMHFQSNDSFVLAGPYATEIYLAKNSSVESFPDKPNRMNQNWASMSASSRRKEYLEDSKFHSAPLILEGAYSLDDQEFLWSGDCILILPQTNQIIKR